MKASEARAMSAKSHTVQDQVFLGNCYDAVREAASGGLKTTTVTAPSAEASALTQRVLERDGYVVSIFHARGRVRMSISW